MKKIGLALLLVSVIVIIFQATIVRNEVSTNGLTVREFLLTRSVVVQGDSPKFERVYKQAIISNFTFSPEATRNPQNTYWRSGDAYFLFTGGYDLDCRFVHKDLSGSCGSQ